MRIILASVNSFVLEEPTISAISYKEDPITHGIIIISWVESISGEYLVSSA